MRQSKAAPGTDLKLMCTTMKRREEGEGTGGFDERGTEGHPNVVLLVRKSHSQGVRVGLRGWHASPTALCPRAWNFNQLVREGAQDI